MYPHTSDKKRCKVKEDVGGRDVKAEVLRERDRWRESEREGDGESRSRSGVNLFNSWRSGVRIPQFTRPQARVAPTRYDSLYFAFGVG